MPRRYSRPDKEPNVKIEAYLDAKTNRMLEDIARGYNSRSEALREIIREAWQKLDLLEEHSA